MLDKNSIFYALYYGAVSPWENSKLPQSREYKKLTSNACELQEKVHSLLNDEGKKLFEDFLKADAEIGGHFEEEKFKEGFVLGAKLMIETLTDNSFSN